MHDLVLDGFVKNFADARGLSAFDEPDLFEAFVAYSLFRKYHQADLADIENYTVGGGGDGGLDAVGIFVNGRPVHADEDVTFFADTHGRLDVEFAFIQAKTGSSFNASEIGSFVFGVEQFFVAVTRSAPQIPFSEPVQQLIELAQHIYFDHGIQMQNNPKCFLYFATTGKWKNDPAPAGRLSDGQRRIEQLELFSEVRAQPVDSDLLKSIYRELQRSIVKQIEISKTTVFPRISGVDEAYVGLIPGNAFIDLVSTNDGELNRELFYDNVRDFQGHNPINSEIQHTLATEQTRHTFPLLNNGITIVAQDLKRTGDTFTLSNFQIVNGCQTTHILFQNKSRIDDATFVPVKLVVTRDRQVITEVIKATNRQTAVLPEALESLTLFHKELEDFYIERESRLDYSDRIYYERRSKQYSLDNISPKNIVTLTAQIKSFVGMFLNEPHSHPRYYGELLRAYSGRLFVQDHKPAPYYASGVALWAIERWIRSQADGGAISSADKRTLQNYKYHLLMLVRMSIAGPAIPRLNSNAISEYSLKIVDVVRGDERGNGEWESAANRLMLALDGYPRGSDRNPPHRLRAFTAKLMGDQFRIHTDDKPQLIRTVTARTGEQETTGTILWFDGARGYGRIETAEGEELFVNSSEISVVPWHLRTSGTPVVFGVGPDPVADGQMMAMRVTVDVSESDQIDAR